MTRRLAPVACVLAALALAPSAPARAQFDDSLVVPINGEVIVPPPGFVLDVNREIAFGEVFISRNDAILCRYDIKADGSLVVGTQVRSGMTDTTGAPPGCGVTNALPAHPSELSLACPPDELVNLTQIVGNLANDLSLLAIALRAREEDSSPLASFAPNRDGASFICPASGKVLLDIGGALFTAAFTTERSSALVGQFNVTVTLP